MADTNNTDMNTEAAHDLSVEYKKVEVPDGLVALVVGEDQHTILVPKEKLMCMEPLQAALTNPWRESQENRITLPEDDVGTWEIAVEILTGDKTLTDGAPIQVLDLTGNLIEYYHGGCHQQMGDWTFSEATLTQFSNLVNLFELADKYLWVTLREECLEMIIQFPIGPEAFAILAALPQELYKIPEGSERSFKSGVGSLNTLIQGAMKYHSARYDEWYGGVRQGSRNWTLLEKRSEQYKSLDSFMKDNMTAEAWAVYTGLAEYRAQSDRQSRSDMDRDNWECCHEQQGVLISNWNLFEAVDYCLDREELNERPYGVSPEAETRWYDEKFSKLFPDHPFSEAIRGDIIIQIDFGLLDSSKILDFNYFSGYNPRTQQHGWYPRSLVRLLEERSKEHCNGTCCQEGS